MRIHKTFEGSKLKISSDFHYGHENVIGFDSRPFPDVDSMNQWIRSEIKTKIKPGDSFFDLGDMFWKTKDNEALEILRDITSRAEFWKVKGNHDETGGLWKELALRRECQAIEDLLEIQVEFKGNHYRLILCHFPLVSWNHKSQGSWMIHGHCHGNIDSYNTQSPDLRVDVGLFAGLAKGRILDFPTILREMLRKSGGNPNFKEYVKQNCTEL